MPIPDWSSVTWYVYETPGRTPRVSGRELSGGEMRKGEALAGEVRAVPRCFVLRGLKAGKSVAAIVEAASSAAGAQHRRSADNRRPNAYREWIARLEAEKRAKHDKAA